jgi:hypothetical protein
MPAGSPPKTQQPMTAYSSVQLRQERQFLSHETFGAISIADPREAAAGADESAVRAFARMERLARIAAEPRKELQRM